MNITLPNISPQVMRKYPLYVLIVFLSGMLGYYINTNSNKDNEKYEFLIGENKKLQRDKDSLNRVLSDFKDILLIKNGTIEDYRKVVEKTDSITKKNLRQPAEQLLKIAK